MTKITKTDYPHEYTALFTVTVSSRNKLSNEKVKDIAKDSINGKLLKGKEPPLLITIVDTLSNSSIIILASIGIITILKELFNL